MKLPVAWIFSFLVINKFEMKANYVFLLLNQKMRVTFDALWLIISHIVFYSDFIERYV